MSDVLSQAKTRLDLIISKGRVHLYKPIQIAEILYHDRIDGNFNLNNSESYRKESRFWRDAVSPRLVGRACTSSSRFQDNLFDDNAMHSNFMAALGEENIKPDRVGIVEYYIYRALEYRLNAVKVLERYIAESSPETFDLVDFLDEFRESPGLARSIDKAYEITVFALFDTIVRNLNATVTVKIPVEKNKILEDFEDFTEIVLGVNSKQNELSTPARLYRVGVTNAADRGLDMWANFGPAVQVKHLSLTDEIAEDIVDEVRADRIVIVCLKAEKSLIEKLLNQLGFSHRIQGIVTQDELSEWYSICFSKYGNSLGKSLIQDLHREFIAEFPSVGDVITNFIQERGYNNIEMNGIFAE